MPQPQPRRPSVALYFSRRRIMETSFYMPCEESKQDGSKDLKEIYRVSTTVRKHSIFPDTTTIEYVEPEDEEKHHVVATIWWAWPSPISTIIEIGGKRCMIKDFLTRDANLLHTETHLLIGSERFTWRSAVFRPAYLCDSEQNSVAWFTPQVRGLHPRFRASSILPGCLNIEEEAFSNAYTRDVIVASFFVYRACCEWRILLTPWWRQEQADFTGITLKKEDDEGEHASSFGDMERRRPRLATSRRPPLVPPSSRPEARSVDKMDLYFSSRRFFLTGFFTPLANSIGQGQLREIYRVTTTVRKGTILPETTAIEYVGAEDEEKHYTVATIEWHWPSQGSSIVEIDGKRLPIKEFLKREGLLSTGTHVIIGDERFTWRSAVGRPAQLFNPQKQSVARLTPHSCDLRPLNHALVVQPGCLHISQEIARDEYSRDLAIASFFVYRACRDLQIFFTPWWKKGREDLIEMRVKN